jgi:hypothetical protein
MRTGPAILMLTQLAGLCACTTPEAAVQPTGREQPATILNASSEVRAELLAAVTSALRNNAITIADDALTTTNVLIIERVPARDANGRPLSGRDFGRPQHFQLLKDGEHCILVHQETGRRFPLKKARCMEFTSR